MPTGPDGAHSWAQSIRRQAGSPSVQFSPVNLRNFTPVLTPTPEFSCKASNNARAARVVRALSAAADVIQHGTESNVRHSQ